MNLQKFPLDSQTCPLEIGSFGHDASDIVYKVKFCHYVSCDAQSTLILRANKIKSAITSYLDRTLLGLPKSAVVRDPLRGF